MILRLGCGKGRKVSKDRKTGSNTNCYFSAFSLCRLSVFPSSRLTFPQIVFTPNMYVVISFILKR